jgi:hypothetical protein
MHCSDASWSLPRPSAVWPSPGQRKMIMNLTATRAINPECRVGKHDKGAVGCTAASVCVMDSARLRS